MAYNGYFGVFKSPLIQPDHHATGDTSANLMSKPIYEELSVFLHSCIFLVMRSLSKNTWTPQECASFQFPMPFFVPETPKKTNNKKKQEKTRNPSPWPFPIPPQQRNFHYSQVSHHCPRLLVIDNITRYGIHVRFSRGIASSRRYVHLHNTKTRDRRENTARNHIKNPLAL